MQFEVQTVKHSIPAHLTLNIEPTILTINTYTKVENNEDTNDSNIVDGSEVSSSLFGEKLFKETLMITLEELKARQEFKDCSLWILFHEGTTPIGLYNSFARTYSEKLSSGIQNMLSNRNNILQIQVPFATYNFSQMCYRINKPEGFFFGSNKMFTEVNKLSPIMDNFPKIEVTGPTSIAPDACVEFTIRTAIGDKYTNNQPSTIYLTNHNGYTPKTLLPMTDYTKFAVCSWGLKEGDFINIKAGFRYRSSLVDFNLPVKATV